MLIFHVTREKQTDVQKNFNVNAYIDSTLRDPLKVFDILTSKKEEDTVKF